MAVFGTVVRLRLGANDIAVSASEAGREAAEHSVTVTRKRTAKEVAALRQRREEARLARGERERQQAIEAEQERQRRIAAATKSFSGNGEKNIGTVRVHEESILEWTNASSDPTFRQMLIYDEGFGISVSSEAASGDTVVPPGTYRNITVAGSDNWTITIHPR